MTEPQRAGRLFLAGLAIAYYVFMVLKIVFMALILPACLLMGCMDALVAYQLGHPVYSFTHYVWKYMVFWWR